VTAEIRVALIGYGLAGAVFHAPTIAVTPGLRLATIVTRDPERRARAGREHPAARVVDTAEQIFAQPAPHDLVVIATPNSTHVPLALAALATGHAVVIDKPFAPSPDEGRRIVADARRRGLFLSVYHQRRWDSDTLTIRRLLAEGVLGEVVRFESRLERWRPQPGRGWRERAGPGDAGGLLYDLGAHLVDQALHLFGPVTHVYGELARRRPGAAVDDDVFVALTHASGTRSHLWAGTRPDRPDWGVEPAERWGRLGAGDAVRPVSSEPGAYPHYYAAVAASLRAGAPPPVDAADAVAGLEIIAAVQRSATGHHPVALGAGS
jgi:scyllo-inositol 2-dehydrogenase (NADP+)